MSHFLYKAINEAGRIVEGHLEAESIASAEHILISQGLIPSKVSASLKGNVEQSGFLTLNQILKKVKVAELIIFTKQFRSMLMAGVPILRLLQVLEEQTENKLLRAVINSVAGDIRQGTTLTEAMNKHPKVFVPLYRSMINAGEQSGTLTETMSRLIYILEHEEKVRSDIRAALQYPIIVLIALGIAFFILLNFVIPKFISIFDRAGIALPLPTKIAMLLYQFLHNYWMILLVGIVGLIFGLRSYFKTEKGQFIRDTFFLKMPLFGPLLKKAAMSRFASIFSILQASGVHVMDAMRILSGTIGNKAISKEFDRLREKVQEGQGIAMPLRSSKYFTPMVVDMLAIGEESGTIDEMLKAVSKHYDEEVEYAVKKLSDALGPILVVGLAVVVGFFALAIFMPMWDLTKMVK